MLTDYEPRTYYTSAQARRQSASQKNAAWIWKRLLLLPDLKYKGATVLLQLLNYFVLFVC